MSGIDWIKTLFGTRSDAGLGEDVMSIPPEDAKCMLNGKAFEIKYHPLKAPRHCVATDEIVCNIDGEEVARETIAQPMTIDTVATYRVKDALGFKHGVGAVFGERS